MRQDCDLAKLVSPLCILYPCQIRHLGFLGHHIFLILSLEASSKRNHEMIGRFLRKMVVSRIAAGILTKRFFRIEPGGQMIWWKIDVLSCDHCTAPVHWSILETIEAVYWSNGLLWSIAAFIHVDVFLGTIALLVGLLVA